MSRPIWPALAGALALAGATGAATLAGAQSIYSNSASYNTGYGRAPGQENRAVENFGLRDSDGNLVIIDGVIQNDVSSYSASSSSASASASASAGGSFSGGVGGQSSATAIGNNLTVITQGDFNTVIIDSTQINNGDVTASAATHGGASNGQ